MTPPTPLLADCIRIRGRFLRSINVEKDYEAAAQNGDYILTPTARDVLRRVTEGLSPDSTYRAWTITGPYGVGKSAFAVFLTRLLCHGGDFGKAAWRQLEEADAALASELADRIGRPRGDKRRLLPVLLTARRAPAALCLTEAVQAELARMRLRGKQSERLSAEASRLVREVRKGQVPDSRQLTSLIGSFGALARGAGYTGILVLVDELGKLFEFAARVPQRGDVFAIQEIAEHAARSAEFPFLFFGFLHQAFEDYGHHLDGVTRKEWAKIHGRFEDVAFLEPAEQVVRMIARAIKWSENIKPRSDLRARVVEVARQCAASGVIPTAMRASEFEDLCVRAYPLHPTTLVALPFIFRRFAQNERSLFSYLSSLEPGGFQEFLRTNSLSSKPAFIRLDSLFDYFTVNFGTGLFRQPQARRWMEAADVLERKDELQPDDVQIVKAIGVLGALGDFSHLRPLERMISVAVTDRSDASDAVSQRLQRLRERSILTYRAFNSTYRVWEGSDVDIDDRVAEGRRTIRGSISLATAIQQYLQPRPLVARRHSFETGALRYFHTVYVDDPFRLAEPQAAPSGVAGQVFVCLSGDAHHLHCFRQAAEAAKGRSDTLIAIPQQIGELLEAVTELAAMRWAWENTPALRDDRVARRELATRVTEAEHLLRRSLSSLLDPRPEPAGSGCLWYWNGERQRVRSRVAISQLLSSASDVIFCRSPRIRNELIVRRILSSAAAAARRDLIERMLGESAKKRLGIGEDEYPPERSMYESVLKATGMHAPTSTGTWGFGPPPLDNATRLRPSWDRLRDLVFEAQGEPVAVHEIFADLSRPCLGVVEGLHPVLLCAFMQVFQDEVSLYREGTFVAEPGIADFEVLMRRPELFALAGGRLAGARVAVVERIAKGLGTPAKTVPVVRALFRMVKHLPELAWRTCRLAERARRVRQAFEKARAPERFLFADLPVALDLPPFTEEGGQENLIQTFFERLNQCLDEWSGVAGKVHDEARRTLLEACGVEASDRGWQHLREAARHLEPREPDPFLRQVLKRMAESGDDTAGLASVLAFVSGRPPANWVDEDIERFPQLAQGVGEAIRRAAARAGRDVGGPPVLEAMAPEDRERARSLAAQVMAALDALRREADPTLLRAALLLAADYEIDGGVTRR